MKPTKITPAVRALANGTANSEGSPALTGVLINTKEAVAANGFMLIIKPLPAPEMEMEELSENGIPDVIVPADALKACKGDKVQLTVIETMHRPTGQLATEPETKNVVRLDGEDFSIEADAVRGTFPDYMGLFQMSPLVAQIGISPQTLKQLLKALPDSGVLQLRISSPDKPIEFQCSDPDGEMPIRGLIMPMNCAWLHTQWVTHKTAES